MLHSALNGGHSQILPRHSVLYGCHSQILPLHSALYGGQVRFSNLLIDQFVKNEISGSLIIPIEAILSSRLSQEISQCALSISLVTNSKWLKWSNKSEVDEASHLMDAKLATSVPSCRLKRCQTRILSTFFLTNIFSSWVGYSWLYLTLTSKTPSVTRSMTVS